MVWVLWAGWVFLVAFGDLFLGFWGNFFGLFRFVLFCFFNRQLMLSFSVLSEDDIWLLQKAVFC